MNNLKADRPLIITSEIEAIGFYRKMNTQAAVEKMIAGEYVIVEEFFSNGLQVLSELKRVLKLTYKSHDFKSQREYRKTFRDISHRLLLKVENNELVVRKSPDIGWLKLLYPDVSDFYISFPEVQGLNSSWQWYLKGVKIDLLKLTIHPYYGTYFPTRFDHLELLDQWLRTYNGPKVNALDIGIGSGVLSFQLIENGFKKVFGVDTNINAIIGLIQESKRLGLEERLELRHSDLFSGCDIKTELILFNPPWLIAQHKLEEGIDKAIYYEEDLFPRFFEQAEKHLAPGGRIVLLFSNLAQIIGTDGYHPIEKELRESDRFNKELFLQKSVKAASKNTKRTDSRKKEKVELWVLAHKSGRLEK